MPRPRLSVLILLTGLLGLAITGPFSGGACACSYPQTALGGGEYTPEKPNESLRDSFSWTINKERGETRGTINRYLFRYSPGADEVDAAEQAAALQEHFNTNSESWLEFLNAHVVASYDFDVIELAFEGDGGTTSIYFVADVNPNADKFESAQIVDDTNRSVDGTITGSGQAAAKAPDEAEQFHDTYVASNESLDIRYIARIGEQYGEDVDESLSSG